MKAAERRASILAVAKILFADCGYHGVSVDEIAKRLGVSPAVLYQHFASKVALYEAVLNEIACHRESYVEAALAGPATSDAVSGSPSISKSLASTPLTAATFSVPSSLTT